MIKAIIVDDEAPALRELERMLVAIPGISVTGTARSVESARGMLLRTRPDVLFLDIRLGKQSGFDLLSDVDPETAVVFVTAYDSYAVRAFEANALDYLVKPVESARLNATVERVQRMLDQRTGVRATPNGPTTFTVARWLFLERAGRPEFVEVATVTHLVSEGRHTRICTSDGRSRTANRSLVAWERSLPPDDFKRVHRNIIVNLRQVRSIEPWSNYSYRIHLTGSPEPVIMSRRFSLALRNSLP